MFMDKTQEIYLSFATVLLIHIQLTNKLHKKHTISVTITQSRTDYPLPSQTKYPLQDMTSTDLIESFRAITM